MEESGKAKESLVHFAHCQADGGLHPSCSSPAVGMQARRPHGFSAGCGTECTGTLKALRGLLCP